MKKYFIVSCLMLFPFISQSQTYKKISGFSDIINEKLEHFLASTTNYRDRKIAVFKS